MQNYTPDKHTSGYYWLASPTPNSENDVRIVKWDGSISGASNHYGCEGVRPVVSITNVKLQRNNENGNIWEIAN